MQLKEHFDLDKQAKEWGIPLWQHPQFLFLIFGILIIVFDLFLYLIGGKHINIEYDQLVIIIFSVTGFLLCVAFLIERTFEKMADTTKMKTEFISIVSHQLRTPVTNLSLILDLIKKEYPEIKENDMDYFRILEENIIRVKDLISNLLIASRIEKGNFITQKEEEIDYEDVIKDSIKHHSMIAKQKDVSLEYKRLLPIGFYTGDIYQIKIIIDNLIANSILYNKKGGRVDVTLEVDDKFALIKVKDTGIGIPEKDKKHIKDKFHRGANARREHPGGTGLGMYITISLVKALKGEFGFESEEGKGSLFWVKLPLNKK